MRIEARVIHIGRTVAIALTEAREKVLIPLSFGGVAGLEKGDLISFEAQPANQEGWTGVGSPCKYFARHARIRGRVQTRLGDDVAVHGALSGWK